jgi:predicted XRE-type DNA-binding protein
MADDKIKKSISELAKNDSQWQEKAEYRINNASWLDISAEIAIKLLTWLGEHNKTQVDLAAMLDISPEYMSKIVKGHENLTLETICKLQDVTHLKLIALSPKAKKIRTQGRLRRLIPKKIKKDE